MDMKKAYTAVLEDMLNNGPATFQGYYDAEHGNKYYMFGICTVLEHIVLMAGESYKLADEFSAEFNRNMIKCANKVKGEP